MDLIRKTIVVLALCLSGMFIFMAINTFPGSKRDVYSNGQVYLAEMVEHTTLKNGVNGLITVFRPLETLGCLLVLLCGGISVQAVNARREKKRWESLPYESTVLSVVSGIFFPMCLVFALYLLGGYGFNVLGGGIQGGIMLTAGGILFFLVFGHKQFEVKFHAQEFLLFSLWGLILFCLGFLLINFVPALATPLGIFPMELGLLLSIAAILMALFWALAQEEE